MTGDLVTITPSERRKYYTTNSMGENATSFTAIREVSLAQELFEVLKIENLEIDSGGQVVLQTRTGNKTELGGELLEEKH